MEFFFAVFFLLLYYIRPQDWVAGMAGMTVVKPIIAAWLLVLMAARSRPSPLPGIFRTPHDWILLAYYLYVGLTAPDVSGTLKGFLPLVAFYFLTVQSLNTWPRLLSYLRWWGLALLVVALFGVLSVFGIDITGAREVTDLYRGRLSLGTWLHNNPNALGHTVIVLLPLGYVLFFWRRPAASRLFVYPAVAAIAGYCAWRTESKGAFVVGGILVTLIFVIGRPKLVQLFALGTAMTLGISALSFLPRMSEMGDLRSDEGVQGRLLAWEMARAVSKSDPTGQGWNQFIAYIPWREGLNFMVVPKATHSSYVQVGADLGIYGMFFYLAGMWCAFHTLVSLKPANDEQERCRRAILLVLAGYVLSGWMINRQYHTEYFLVIAAAAAAHRLRKGEEALLGEPAAPSGLEPAADILPPEAPFSPEPRPAGGPVPRPAFRAPTRPLSERLGPLWNRLGLTDLAACAALTWLTFWTWDYLMRSI